jgi:CO/xanthine dehydrogenase Mo-binding subunit
MPDERPLAQTGIVVTAAAVPNALFRATGKPVRGLPIATDKLLS